MISVIQRVREASVDIGGQRYSSIGPGLLILLGIGHDDQQEDIDWLVKKLCNLRVFSDQEDKMNLSVKDIGGELLVVSQFTLLASTKKGNRPSFVQAAPPPIAIPLYESFIREAANEMGKPIRTGVFGADMRVNLINDGPVSIVIDTKNKR